MPQLKRGDESLIFPQHFSFFSFAILFCPYIFPSLSFFLSFLLHTLFCLSFTFQHAYNLTLFPSLSFYLFPFLHCSHTFLSFFLFLFHTLLTLAFPFLVFTHVHALFFLFLFQTLLALPFPVTFLSFFLSLPLHTLFTHFSFFSFSTHF